MKSWRIWEKTIILCQYQIKIDIHCFLMNVFCFPSVSQVHYFQILVFAFLSVLQWDETLSKGVCFSLMLFYTRDFFFNFNSSIATGSVESPRWACTVLANHNRADSCPWCRRACGHVDVGTCPHQVLAATLTLSQPGGQIMPTLYTGVHTKFWKPKARLMLEILEFLAYLV